MKLYFAPMEGITGYVFRNAYAACYGGIDTYYTPFLSNPSLNHIELGDVLPEHNTGLHVVPQILTNRVQVFVAIAKTLKDFGYREVNLNLGCPSGTVVAKGRGSGALREPKELDRLLDEIYTQSPLPVSVKTRIGIRSAVEWEDILAVYQRYPLTELIIHPRVQKQFYKEDVCMEAYREAYLAYGLGTWDPMISPAPPETTGASSPPLLCYNGDIRSAEDAGRIIEAFPATHALMLGRGLLWNPELAEQIRGNMSRGTVLVMPKEMPEGTVPMMSRGPASGGMVPTSEGAPSGRRLSYGEAPESFHDAGKGLRLRRFLDLLYDGYLEEMDREGPALMKLKELWAYLKDYAGLSDAEMRPLWKTKTLAEYRDVVTMLLS